MEAVIYLVTINIYQNALFQIHLATAGTATYFLFLLADRLRAAWAVWYREFFTGKAKCLSRKCFKDGSVPRSLGRMLQSS